MDQELRLAIAIPALNEEQSIAAIIERCLAARETIIAGSAVTEVTITVVSDGSTDRTAEIAARYRDQIELIVFDQNRGYGAAIKAAWQASHAELLGFLDADGTCDPLFFTDLCRCLCEEDADVVLGSRLGPDSRMPAIRRLGNRIFAAMLSAASSRRISDSASGMRVVRRSSLERLMPLPDGLHFTPAMSARAVLAGDVAIRELEMPYEEREGRSKLNVLRDGIAFFKVIMRTMLLYRPARPLALAALVFLSAAIGLMVMPTVYYLVHASLLEWMIYRFAVANLLGGAAVLCACAAYLEMRIVDLALFEARGVERQVSPAARLLSSRLFWTVPAALLIGGAWLVLPSFLELVQTGGTSAHWSRFIAMSFLASTALILVITRVIDYNLDLILERLRFLRSRLG